MPVGCSNYYLEIITQADVKAWRNTRKISTQHLTILLHDVATCIERAGQTHVTLHVDVYDLQSHGTQQVDLALAVIFGMPN